MAWNIDPIAVALAFLALYTVKRFYSWWFRGDEFTELLAEAASIQCEHESLYGEDIDPVLEGEADVKKVARKHKGSFRTYLVQMGKAKFGTPTQTEANRLVVRKYLYDLCRERGLVARHIVDHLDMATALVFVPSREELVSLAITQTALSRDRGRIRKGLGGGSPTTA
jgi:hypothetical protein